MPSADHRSLAPVKRKATTLGAASSDWGDDGAGRALAAGTEVPLLDPGGVACWDAAQLAGAPSWRSSIIDVAPGECLLLEGIGGGGQRQAVEIDPRGGGRYVVEGWLAWGYAIVDARDRAQVGDDRIGILGAHFAVGPVRHHRVEVD